MFSLDKDEFMRIMAECQKSYMEMLCEKLYGESEDEDEEDGIGKDMELPESAQQPKNVNKLIASASNEDEYKGHRVYLNFYMGEE